MTPAIIPSGARVTLDVWRGDLESTEQHFRSMGWTCALSPTEGDRGRLVLRLMMPPGALHGMIARTTNGPRWVPIGEIDAALERGEGPLAVARAHRVSVADVRARVAAIAHAKPAPIRIPRVDWSLWDHLIGVIPDTDLAAHMSVCKRTIGRRRKEIGAPYYGVTAAAVDTMKRPAAPSRPLVAVDWTRWDPELGTEPDRTLAKRIGCSQNVVNKRRNSLGIPVMRDGRVVDWTPIDPLLGTMPDQTLANRFKVAQASVTSRRTRLGIPAHRGVWREPSRPRDWANVDWSLSTREICVLMQATKYQVQERRKVAALIAAREAREAAEAARPKPVPLRPVAIVAEPEPAPVAPCIDDEPDLDEGFLALLDTLAMQA